MGCLRAGALQNWADLPVGFRGNREAVRDAAEQICRRLEWLDKPERLLLEMVYEQGMSIRKIAAVLGQNPSTVARRIRSLVEGLFSPEYQICLRCRSELTPLQMSIARHYFVRKKSRRWLARFHRISLYALNRHLETMTAFIDRQKVFSNFSLTAAAEGRR
ncbi:MAG TPA: helix-turn-helix domain-containing protein [Anaerohalosphaeraceae bacterium]|nr:helix-turn-helix domain-containing protein [Anaerohalosphaeraceae bacterium]HOL89339.1 helix-turn-helix domain-containing protein [Anaerohalosphaeraceae bacterium]HPP56778.1 helix-turn-helix domain-containing protein [Anaerohalosphaeraceae bacterium]